MRKIIIALIVLIATLLAIESRLFEVYRGESAIRHKAAQPIPNKYHYSEGGHGFAVLSYKSVIRKLISRVSELEGRSAAG